MPAGNRGGFLNHKNNNSFGDESLAFQRWWARESAHAHVRWAIERLHESRGEPSEETLSALNKAKDALVKDTNEAHKEMMRLREKYKQSNTADPSDLEKSSEHST